MKKDYAPVIDMAAAAKNEAAYVEDHWSRLWQKRDVDPELADSVVYGREEYRLLRAVLRNYPQKARILDAGCGLGQWTICLAKEGYNCTGFDISEDVVRRLKEANAPGNYLAGDIRSTKFESNSFDVCFSWGVFEHFELGPDACFEEAFRIIAPGGALLVSVPFLNRRHMHRMRKPLWKVDGRCDLDKGYGSKMRFYQWRLTEQELRQQALMAGFKVKSIHFLDRCEGVRRMFLEIKPDFESSRLFSPLCKLLAGLLPRSWICHMILIEAYKPSEAQ